MGTYQYKENIMNIGIGDLVVGISDQFIGYVEYIIKVNKNSYTFKCINDMEIFDHPLFILEQMINDNHLKVIKINH